MDDTTTVSACPRTVSESVQEYARGMIGGLLFSLPLLYTEEVWLAGHLLSPAGQLLYVIMIFGLLLGYNRFAGMRCDASWREVVIDSIEEMGLGCVMAGLILFLLGEIDATTSVDEMLGKTVMQAMAVAIGVSVGTAQLGTTAPQGMESDPQSNDDDESPESDVWGQTILALCGAVLVAGSIAPTQEVVIIAGQASPLRLMGIAVLALLLDGLVMFASQEHAAKRFVVRDGLISVVFSISIGYAVSFLAAAGMLWLLGRFDGQGFEVCLARTIVLALPAVLGASAGRLLIQQARHA